MDAWVGVDLGTQSVRALVADDAGRTLGSGSVPLRSHRDGNRHEQDPTAWWAASSHAIGAALTQAGAVRVRGLAVDATSGSIAMLDEQGCPLTPGLMYDDGRATAQLTHVNEAGADQWAAAGYRRMQRSWALPKLLWLLEEHPELRRQNVRLAHQSDVVNRALVGHPVATDTSNALKTGVDVAGAAWPTDVIGTLGIPIQLLPDVVVPGTLLGRVCDDAAGAAGLSAGTPVFAGMTDGCASQIGSGAVTVGSWNSVLGTTLVLKGVADDLVADTSGVVYSHRSPTGHWLPGGASSVGAGLVARHYPDADVAALSDAAERLLPTSVLHYPLVSQGERFPFVAPQAREFLMSEPRDGTEAFAALLQGTAYVERLCFDYLDLLGAPAHGRLMLTGGAARNPVWTQLRADVLGRPVELPANAQPALGMAVLAAAATDDTDLRGRAAAMVRVDRVVEPRPTSREEHGSGYLQLVDELAARGWLPAAVAAHATKRSSSWA